MERARKRIEILLGRAVTGYDGRRAHLSTGETIETATPVWTAGIRANPLLEHLPVERDSLGRIRVTPFLEVPGHPGVFALGDNAHVPGEGGDPLPPEAQVALQQAKYLARSLAARLAGKGCKPFRFFRYGRLVSLGSRYAVVSILGFDLWGFFAWWIWRTVYLVRLHSLRARLRVMIDWTLDLFYPRETVRFEIPEKQGSETVVVEEES
ncbi:MAG: hypothetical protein D6795_01550 [Deltaproteobacteria bacterium]|nr:MAG: hypothetical protein D6795_01550 [Deltaproteobacteria bacterium]